MRARMRKKIQEKKDIEKKELGKVWLTAWCAVASGVNCVDTSTVDKWADECVTSYKLRYNKNFIQDKPAL